jgi:hypothetical protein
MKIKDLRAKIMRLLKEYFDNPDVYVSSLNHIYVKLYLFTFGLKDKRKQTFEMIYAFKNKFSCFNVIAEEIADDELLIEVKLIFIF